jgi:hypothetical protein
MTLRDLGLTLTGYTHTLVQPMNQPKDRRGTIEPIRRARLASQVAEALRHYIAARERSGDEEW